MQSMVRQEKFGSDMGLVHEAVVTGRKVGASRSFWKGLAHDEQFFQEVMLVARRFGYGGWFISPAEQLELVKARNFERNWGFTAEDFFPLGEPPAWPDGDLCAVVLAPALKTLQETLEEAWLWAAEVQENNRRWDALLSDEKSLRLFTGKEHKRGLSWRVVDLGANWDKQNGIAPKDVRNPKSPDCEILIAAALFPNWIQAMDGVNVPYVWIPGLEVSVSGDPAWSDVPSLNWHRDDHEVGLNAAHCELRHRLWAVPAFRE